MNKEELKKQYKQYILKKNREPYHFEKRENAAEQLLAYNPICGDRFNLYLEREQSKIGSAWFHGFGCALSKASTSVLIEKIENKSDQEIASLCREFLEALDDGRILGSEDVDQKALVEMRNLDGRIDCIKLSWEALLNYVKNGKEVR